MQHVLLAIAIIPARTLISMVLRVAYSATLQHKAQLALGRTIAAYSCAIRAATETLMSDALITCVRYSGCVQLSKCSLFQKNTAAIAGRRTALLLARAAGINNSRQRAKRDAL